MQHRCDVCEFQTSCRKLNVTMLLSAISVARLISYFAGSKNGRACQTPVCFAPDGNSRASSVASACCPSDRRPSVEAGPLTSTVERLGASGISTWDPGEEGLALGTPGVYSCSSYMMLDVACVPHHSSPHWVLCHTGSVTRAVRRCASQWASVRTGCAM